MRGATYTHKFVKAVPEQLEDGILYVSVEFAAAAHRCLCGCGSEVYTRFSPTDWSMKFDGESVSISPSIGNWSFPCQSHYVLANGRVRWAEHWSRERIDRGRAMDRERKERHFKGVIKASPASEQAENGSPQTGPLARLLRWLIGN